MVNFDRAGHDRIRPLSMTSASKACLSSASQRSVSPDDYPPRGACNVGSICLALADKVTSYVDLMLSKLSI